MRHPITLAAVLVGFSSNAIAAEPHRLAYSERMGVEVFALPSETAGWCRDTIDLKLVLKEDSSLLQGGILEFLPKLGPVLTKDCPAATMLHARSFKQKGDLVLDGPYTASKSMNWAAIKIQQQAVRPEPKEGAKQPTPAPAEALHVEASIGATGNKNENSQGNTPGVLIANKETYNKILDFYASHKNKGSHSPWTGAEIYLESQGYVVNGDYLDDDRLLIKWDSIGGGGNLESGYGYYIVNNDEFRAKKAPDELMKFGKLYSGGAFLEKGRFVPVGVMSDRVRGNVVMLHRLSYVAEVDVEKGGARKKIEFHSERKPDSVGLMVDDRDSSGFSIIGIKDDMAPDAVRSLVERDLGVKVNWKVDGRYGIMSNDPVVNNEKGEIVGGIFEAIFSNVGKDLFGRDKWVLIKVELIQSANNLSYDDVLYQVKKKNGAPSIAFQFNVTPRMKVGSKFVGDWVHVYGWGKQFPGNMYSEQDEFKELSAAERTFTVKVIHNNAYDTRVPYTLTKNKKVTIIDMMLITKHAAEELERNNKAIELQRKQGVKM